MGAVRSEKRWTMVLTVDEQGCLKVPKSVVDSLGLRPGMPVQVERRQGALVLCSEPTEQPVEVREGIPVFTGELAGDLEGAIFRSRERRVEVLTSPERR